MQPQLVLNLSEPQCPHWQHGVIMTIPPVHSSRSFQESPVLGLPSVFSQTSQSLCWGPSAGKSLPRAPTVPLPAPQPLWVSQSLGDQWQEPQVLLPPGPGGVDRMGGREGGETFLEEVTPLPTPMEPAHHSSTKD